MTIRVDPSLLSAERPRLHRGWSLVLGAGAVAFVAALGLLLLVIVDLEDVLRAWPSPERHDHVRELRSGEAASVRGRAARTTEDFDGDGTADRLHVEYLHMEPLFRRATSGLVRVRSGRTGELLLAHAIATPVNRVRWCGDHDGNGTEDLYVEDEGRAFVLGHVAGR